jgi:hypothetical protein
MKEAIINHVRANPGCTAKTIRAAIAGEFPGITKSDVNKVLYGSGEVTKIDAGGAPKWEPAMTTA